MSGLKYKTQIEMQVPPTEPNHVVRLNDFPPDIFEIIGGKLYLKISLEDGNFLEVKPDGLYAGIIYSVIDFEAFNLTYQVTGEINVFDIDSRIVSIDKIDVYYAGIKLTYGVDYEINYKAKTLTVLTETPLDAEDNRGFELVVDNGSDQIFDLTNQLDPWDSPEQSEININVFIRPTDFVVLYYAGMRLVYGQDYTIDYNEHKLRLLLPKPADSRENRKLVLMNYRNKAMEVDLSGQMDGANIEFLLDPLFTETNFKGLYYAGLRLAKGINYTINWPGQSSGTNIITINMSPLDDLEGRRLIAERMI